MTTILLDNDDMIRALRFVKYKSRARFNLYATASRFDGRYRLHYGKDTAFLPNRIFMCAWQDGRVMFVDRDLFDRGDSCILRAHLMLFFTVTNITHKDDQHD